MDNLELRDSQTHLVLEKQHRKAGDDEEELRNFAVAQTLCITYGAKAGGIAVLTGSTLNILAKDYIEM